MQRTVLAMCPALLLACGSPGGGGGSSASGRRRHVDAMPSGTTQTLRAMWGSGANDVYAVGDAEVVAHRAGQGAWTAQTLVANETVGLTLRGVYGAAGSTWVVGDEGAVVRSTDGGQTIFASGGATYAVGSYGMIEASTDAGGAWTAPPSGSTQFLYGAWGTGPGDVYAVGSSGTILHLSGAVWTGAGPSAQP